MFSPHLIDLNEELQSLDKPEVIDSASMPPLHREIVVGLHHLLLKAHHCIHRRRVIVLVDEYDVTSTKAYQRN